VEKKEDLLEFNLVKILELKEHSLLFYPACFVKNRRSGKE